MSASVRISATTARYTSTKCAKSRNSKNRRSSSGSTGTDPGWRIASSETISGEAEPTWWTCSSALGRPAMNEERLTRASLPSHGSDPLSLRVSDGLLHVLGCGDRVLALVLAVDE